MIEIRLARRREATTLAIMSREYVETGLGWSWTPLRLQRRIADERTNVIVATRGATVVGFAVMEYFDERAHLALFAVLPNARRQGVGQAMWSWLRETALVAGIGAVDLEVRAKNTGARDFYRYLGFRDVETVKGYYRGLEAALRMRCLTAATTHSERP